MIIHNPEITGSLSFPRQDGTKVIIQLSTEGGLETVVADATGSVTGTPQSNFSGSFTGSFVGDGSQLTGVAASGLNIDLFNSGVVAGDDNILFSDTDDSGTEKKGTFVSGLNSVGVISGSIQVDVEQTTNFTSFSSSIASTFAGLTSEFNDISNNPFSQSASSVTVSKSIIPTSATIDLGTASNPFRDLYLSSASLYIDGQQVLSSNNSELIITTDVNQSLKLVETSADTITLQTENGDITLAATGTGNIELNAPVQILAGKQILSSDGNAIQFGEDISITGNITVTGTVDSVDIALFKSAFDTLNAKTLVSGSSQVTSLAHLDTANLPEGTNLYYTDARVKTKLNAESVISGSSQVVLSSTSGFITTIKNQLNANSVVSGSSQILNLVSIDEDTMSSNSDTKLPTQQSVKAYVDTEISALVSGSPATLDTLNELAAALGNDPNFATTISNTIGGKVSQSLQIISGNGLTGGGNLTTNRTLNVVGTTDRISVTADAVDIASTYVGQSSITTLGTITTGTWNGTAIADSYISSATAWNAKLDSAGTIATNDYAKFDASGDLTGRSYSEVKTDLSLNNVENTALSTWAGSSNITTLGTIATGTWNGSVIASAYLDADTAHLTGTQTFSGAKTFSSAVTISNSTASTSKTTGALKVTGGIGIGGDVFAGGDVVAYASSDERLKKNIEIISKPIDKVKQLKGVTWTWKDEASEAQKATPAIGVIAQDVEKVLPELVDTRDNGYMAVDYGKMVGLLIEAIKEQQKQIDDLKSRLQ